MVPYYTHVVSKFLSDGVEKCKIKVYTSLNMTVPMIVAPKASKLMSWSVVCRACVNFFFKYSILRNYYTDFDKTSQNCSCHGHLNPFPHNKIWTRPN